MFTVIVDKGLPYCRVTFQFKYIGNKIIQILPGLFLCQRRILGRINNLTKLSKSRSAELIS